MDIQTQNKLLEINQVFYNRYSASFSATRHQVQPGVRRLMKNMQTDDSILDIGCGNATLARALAAHGFSGTYLGVDMSAKLLAEAKTALGHPLHGAYQFQQVDLASPTWQENISAAPYDWLVSFAVLHHLPGEHLRQQTARAFRNLIAPGGHVAVSIWQWHNSPRLRKRVLPWSTVELEPEELDQGDVLLDWRADESQGLRYVHTFDQTSLTSLAVQAGFQVSDTFFSDGKTGDLALYQVWKSDANQRKPAD